MWILSCSAALANMSARLAQVRIIFGFPPQQRLQRSLSNMYSREGLGNVKVFSSLVFDTVKVIDSIHVDSFPLFCQFLQFALCHIQIGKHIRNEVISILIIVLCQIGFACLGWQVEGRQDIEYC